MEPVIEIEYSKYKGWDESLLAQPTHFWLRFLDDCYKSDIMKLIYLFNSGRRIYHEDFICESISICESNCIMRVDLYFILAQRMPGHPLW